VRPPITPDHWTPIVRPGRPHGPRVGDDRVRSGERRRMRRTERRGRRPIATQPCSGERLAVNTDPAAGMVDER